ncbi:MAG: type toxin-antitoxin system PemK/MazF family toxin [Mucilaginibacter sp.]|nr:type toxin-antitoxin system PemK/MazF family toxin [Mucilaginibacter sp.]
MITNVYKQGDIILIRYPLSDKPEKSIIRPVVVVSNGFSNDQDKDVLVCQITTNLRNNVYSYALTDDKLTVAMPELCEVRCNKIATVRVWDKIILDKISEVTPTALTELLMIVKTVF